jgi:hypothetical protein
MFAGKIDQDIVTNRSLTYVIILISTVVDNLMLLSMISLLEGGCSHRDILVGIF